MSILWRGTADPSYNRAPPAGYAMAWKDWDRQLIVYAPVPMNFLLWNFPCRFWSVVGATYYFLKRWGVVWPNSEGCYYWDSRLEWRPWRWLVG